MEVLIVVLMICGFFLWIGNRKPASRKPTDLRPPPATSFAKTRLAEPSRPSAFDTSTATPAAPPPSVLKGPAYVIDGDTIVVQKTQIRLFGIDAPELEHPFGKKAKWAMIALCKGEEVSAEITATDAHGRSVAKCALSDGRDLSAELVKQGLAIDWPKYSKGAYKHLEVPNVRKKLWLADARQKGRMHVWRRFEASRNANRQND